MDSPQKGGVSTSEVRWRVHVKELNLLNAAPCLLGLLPEIISQTSAQPSDISLSAYLRHYTVVCVLARRTWEDCSVMPHYGARVLYSQAGSLSQLLIGIGFLIKGPLEQHVTFMLKP